MSQRTDERTPTSVSLEAYNKVLKLSDHVMSVCKPKDKNVNNCHIPKRNVSIGRMMMDAVVELGADILEANEIYVGKNIGKEAQIEHYKKRIEIQENAKSLTYRIEYIFRILYFDKEFAESTTSYMLQLLTETRATITSWRESDARALKKLL